MAMASLACSGWASAAPPLGGDAPHALSVVDEGEEGLPPAVKQPVIAFVFQLTAQAANAPELRPRMSAAEAVISRINPERPHHVFPTVRGPTALTWPRMPCAMRSRGKDTGR
jgi:hypothetical protein